MKGKQGRNWNFFFVSKKIFFYFKFLKLNNKKVFLYIRPLNL